MKWRVWHLDMEQCYNKSQCIWLACLVHILARDVDVSLSYNYQEFCKKEVVHSLLGRSRGGGEWNYSPTKRERRKFCFSKLWFIKKIGPKKIKNLGIYLSHTYTQWKCQQGQRILIWSANKLNDTEKLSKQNSKKKRRWTLDATFLGAGL